MLFACFILSISAAFEYQLESREYKDDELCSDNRTQAVAVERLELSSGASRLGGDDEDALKAVKYDGSSQGYNFNEDESIVTHHRLVRSFDNGVFSTGTINSTDDDDSLDRPRLGRKTSHNPADVDHYVNDAERDNVTSRVILGRNHNTCSTVSDFYR